MKAKGPRYMLEFGCIGADCEDTCCVGWEIAVDAPHFRRLQRLIGATPEGRADLESAFKDPPRGKRDKQRFKLMVVDHDKRCTFFDGGLCRIHRDFGEEALPNLCALFPRALLKIGERFEVTASAACPEAARHILLSDDAMDLADIPAERAPRPQLALDSPVSTRIPWLAFVDNIRGAFYRALRRDEFDLRSRLYNIACFAHATLPIFSREGAFDGEQLQFELDCIENAEIRAEQHAALTAMPKAAQPVLQLLAQIFGALRRDTIKSRISVLLDEAHVNELDIDGMLTALETSRARLGPMLAELDARMERWLTNYAVNIILHEPYPIWPDLVVYMQQIFVRLAAVRFLIYIHPEVARAATITDEAERRRVLDALGVRVAYSVSRSVEHSPDLLQSIEKFLVTKNLRTLVFSSLLLRLT
jgi:lysine-N-methylase